MYNGLSRAQLSFEYLHTNSTTHEFLFGAIAELVDNSRDASATKIEIYTDDDPSLRGGYMLCFLDDGEGMDPNETADIVTFGKSSKKALDSQKIGMYGNGLKSGSMRIGNDFILFTKKGSLMTCLFLSRTFHEEEGIEEVIVPIPSFDSVSREPYYKGTMKKHNMEMDLILKYSPFKTEEDFFTQFDRIEGIAGTLVVVYNIKLLDSGEAELDRFSLPHDIQLTNPVTEEFDSDEGMMLERKSFRAYASILYVDPRMRIYIQGKKVRTKKLSSFVYKPKQYKYSSNRFRTRSENEAKKSQDEAKSADHKAKEAESKAKNLEKKFGSSLTKDQRAQLRKAQLHAAECKKEAQIRKQIADRKVKSLKDPKSLNFIYGINIENRSHDGVFVYNCGRLIKMYEKVGAQTEGGVCCSGVVGIVDVPYLVLEPTHNKQDFADAKEYRHLLKAMGEHMMQYWKDVGIAQQGALQFWENFGYVSQKWSDLPSVDQKYARKRAMQLNTTIQCDVCFKWRTLPFATNNIGREFPDDWSCLDNTDASHNRCTSAEQKINITEATLKKEVKSQDQKKRGLEGEIKRKQEILDKLEKTKTVLSTAHVREMEKKAEEREKERKKVIASSQKNQTHKPTLTSNSKHRASSAAVSKAKKAPAVKSPPPRTIPRSSPAPSVKSPIRKPAALESKSAAKAVIKPSPKPTPKSPSPMRSPVSTTKPSPVKIEKDDSDESITNSDSSSKKRASSAVANSDSTSGKRRVSSASSTADTETEVPAKKKKVASSKLESCDENEGMEADTVSAVEDSTENTSLSDTDLSPDLGTEVEAQVNSKWYSGVVVKVSSEGRWKIKFEYNSKDKYDKWFQKESDNIKVIKSKSKDPSSPSTISSHDITTNEAPSSSTAATFPPSSLVGEDIIQGYRTCLRYFLPPQWIIDKETISGMTLQELAEFPLDEFFDHYERGLRRLVSNFQTDAANSKKDSDGSQKKLCVIRKHVAKLLKSINEDFDIDPEADGDQVDDLLAVCVRQAAQS